MLIKLKGRRSKFRRLHLLRCGLNWSVREVEAAVADYFSMLRLELTGQRYNKAKLTLMPRLDNRSHGSVELKHQNISAVLIEMGMPYVSVTNHA